MTNPSLLVELFTEELPPKALKKLGEAFAKGIQDHLSEQGLLADDSALHSFATPRRLAVLLTNVKPQAVDKLQRITLMPVAVGLDKDGNPTPALRKKIISKTHSEIDVEQFIKDVVIRENDGKTEQLLISRMASGGMLSGALQVALELTLKNLPIPKVMFYERDDGTAVNFVRPAHKLIALYGAEVLNVQALGLNGGRLTQGHRFHSTGDVSIADADSYVATLKQHHVVASFAERRASIQAQLNTLAQGDEIIAPDALLDEVNSLVEWPRVYECHFEKQFLEVPQECLILTMQTNQKYFATQREGKLTNRFLIVSNIETDDASLIIGGNERVVRPRLADAKFFFDQDRKKTLESRVPELAKVVYHNKLGSQGDRNERVVLMAKALARALSYDEAKAARAAILSKADLTTDMVAEFPELQGIMGTYYARHDGEDAEVAQAITEHYLPRFSGDTLPTTLIGAVVSLADKLETLAGMFSIGALPTGDKDPFALRRHAIGVIRILMEKQLPITLTGFLNIAKAGFKSDITDALASLKIFIGERLSSRLFEQGFTAQEVDAVVSQDIEDLARVPMRLEAVRAFAALPEAEALAAANKRISNILKKSDATNSGVDAALLIEDSEKQLHGALQSVAPLAEKLFHNHEYTASLRELAVLRGPVDTFFDKVMVNAEAPALRNNRLALLKQLHTAMNRVADLSKLAA